MSLGVQIPTIPTNKMPRNLDVQQYNYAHIWFKYELDKIHG